MKSTRKTPDSGQLIWRPKDSFDYANLVEALGNRLEDLWRRHNFEEPGSRLRLVLDEALNNAWEHGNHKSPAKLISISWQMNGYFTLCIEDQGAGFDPNRLPNPCEGGRLFEARGRGVFLIRHYAQEAHWSEDGRRVRIVFSPQAAPPCRPILKL